MTSTEYQPKLTPSPLVPGSIGSTPPFFPLRTGRPHLDLDARYTSLLPALPLCTHQACYGALYVSRQCDRANAVTW